MTQINMTQETDPTRGTVLLKPGEDVVVGYDSQMRPIHAVCEASSLPQMAVTYLPQGLLVLTMLIVFSALRSYGEKPAPKPLHSGIEEYAEDADADDTKN